MKMTKEINWMIEKSKVTKEYADCIKKEFVGKLPYRMVMNAILKNKWTKVSENNNYWNVNNTDSEKLNYGLNYSMKTGIVEFYIIESK